MKIGIYSLPFHSNYGGVLQSYALQTTLQKDGHEVYVLNKDWLNHLGKRDKIEKLICKTLSIVTLQRIYSKRERLIESIKELRRFWSKNICLVNFEEFSEIKKLDLDAIIVGSDQIWRNGYCSDTRWYFLNFTESWNIRRVAYAASFGVSEWQFPTAITDDMRNLAAKFNGISVRESDGVKMCKNYLNTDATFVLDPTLLLSSDDYGVFRTHTKESGSKHLVSFMLHPTTQKKDLVREVASQLNAKVIDLDIPIEDNNDKKRPISYYTSIENWLTELLDADYVLTDSYHGMVFSINFNKPFVTLGNVQGGQSRFTSLLDLFSINNRIAVDKASILKAFAEPVDWKNINDIINEKRIVSRNFLAKSLK